ncbi:MAG: tape measure protein [Bacteroides sp.]|nr:tape measure protein [Bacteroides sp.]
MNTSDGNLWYAMGLDTSQAEQDARRAADQFKQIGDAAVSEGKRIDGAMADIGKATVAYFSFQTLKSFTQDVIRARGEIESFEISFETLLGSKDKAKELFGSIREFAVNTPMQLDTLAQGAQTLLGFGIEAEKVMPLLKQIGDISMGDAQKFSSLTLAFAQASSAGKLAGQDFLQMVNAGFNPLNEISKATGKSIKQLKQDMEDGRITTKELESAFASATAEGGMFHDMLEKQSVGIKGAISNLEGAWNDMLNDIGSKQQSVFVDGVNLLTDMVKNYEDFLNVILGVAAAYGTYKAAVMTVWAIEKARALADNIRLVMMFRKELGLLTAAQQAFNITAWANPYVLLAAAIVGVCTALYLYSDRATTAETAQKALNDEREEFNKSLSEERSKIEDCIKTIQDKTATDFAQVKAYEELKRICPEMAEAYTREKLAVADLAETTKLLNEIQEQKTYEHDLDQLNKASVVLAELKKSQEDYGHWGGVSETTRKMLQDLKMTGKTIDKAIAEYEQNVVTPLRDKVDEVEALRAKAAEEAIPLETRIETQTKVVSDIQSKFDKVKKELDDAQKDYEQNPVFWKKQVVVNLQFQYEGLKSQLEAEDGKLQNLINQQPDTYANAYKNAQKAYNEAYALVQKMKKDRASYTQKEWVDAQEALKETKKTFENLGGEVKSDSTLKSEAKKHKEMLAEIAQIRKGMALQLNQAELQFMEDGKSQRIKAIELETEQTIQSIDKEQKELEKKLKEVNQTLSASDVEYFENRKTAAKKNETNQIRKVEKENTKYIADLYRNLSEVFETEEQRKISSIRNTYAEQRKQLKKDLDGGTISQTQYDDLSVKTDAAEAKEMEDYWLSAYSDYYQKRETLQKQWEANLAEIPAQYQQVAIKRMQEELSALDTEQFKKNMNWDAVFGNLSNQSIQSLTYSLDKVKTYFESAKDSMTVSEIKDFQEAITSMEDEIASRNPFTAMHKSLNDISKYKTELVNALSDMASSQAELKSAQDEYNEAVSAEKEVRERVDRGELAEDSEELANAESRVAEARTNLTNVTERNSQAEQRTLTARNNITKSYKTFATQLQSAGSVVTNLGGRAKNLAAVFSDDIAAGMDKALGFIDEVLDATTSVISSIADVGKSVTKGMEGVVDGMSTSVKGAATATATSISTVEKASIILTVISAALQIATAIANLFNDDDSKQKEIEKLQERIDQLQWELDNAEAVRLQDRYGNAVERLKQIYSETADEVLRLHGISTNSNNWMLQRTGRLIFKNEIYQKSIENIADAYAKVDYTATKALGTQKYDESRKQLENLAEQQILIQQQIDKENSKKKTDHGKIQDWENQIAEIAAEMAEIINSMMEDIIGYTSADLSKELSDAFFKAAKNGEDAMEAWGKKTKEIVADVMQRLLVTKFLEEPIGEIFNQYKKRWFGDDGRFKGIDNVIGSMNDFSDDLNRVGSDFSKIWESLPENVREWFAPEEDLYSQEASKGYSTELSEETGSNLLGRATAIAEAQETQKQSTLRIEVSVMECADSLREGVSIVNEIHDLTGIGIAHLEKIEKHTSRLNEIAETLEDIKRKTDEL